MIDVEAFRKHLVWAEARRESLYDDKTGEAIVLPSGGKITGGVGWNFTDRGIPPKIVDALLDYAIDEVLAECGGLPYWNSLDDVRQLVVADLVYNLGLTRFRKFGNANTALGAGDYQRAADELQYRDGLTKAELSPWYKQTKRRAVKLVEAMRTGVWRDVDT